MWCASSKLVIGCLWSESQVPDEPEIHCMAGMVRHLAGPDAVFGDSELCKLGCSDDG
jgi:hypothetical protein